MALNEIKIEKERLNALLEEVGNELSVMLKAESDALVKSAVDDAPAEASQGSSGPTDPDGDVSDEASAGPPAASADDAAASVPDDGTPDMSETQADAAAQPEGAPGHEAGEIEPAPTVEELMGEYAKLDPEALKMHYLAAKQALMATMGGPDAGGPPPAPEAGPPAGAPPQGPPGPEASAPPPMMGKGEMKGKQMDAGDGNGGEIKMGKSEKDVKIEALEKKVADYDAALLQLTEIVAAPVRKSVKGINCDGG